MSKLGIYENKAVWDQNIQNMTSYMHTLFYWMNQKTPLKKHRYIIINISETFRQTIDLPELKFITEF